MPIVNKETFTLKKLILRVKELEKENTVLYQKIDHIYMINSQILELIIGIKQDNDKLVTLLKSEIVEIPS